MAYESRRCISDTPTLRYDYKIHTGAKPAPRTEQVRVHKRNKSRMNQGSSPAPDMLVLNDRQGRPRQRAIRRAEARRIQELTLHEARKSQVMQNVQALEVGKLTEIVTMAVTAAIKAIQAAQQAQAQVNKVKSEPAKKRVTKSKQSEGVTKVTKAQKAKDEKLAAEIEQGQADLAKAMGTGKWNEMSLSQAAKELAKRAPKSKALKAKADKCSIPLAKPVIMQPKGKPGEAVRDSEGNLDLKATADKFEAEAKAKGTAKRGPNEIHCLSRDTSGTARHTYEVQVPLKWKGTDYELITRCDNQTWDITKFEGEVCHFGGHVTKLDRAKGLCKVEVYVD